MSSKIVTCPRCETHYDAAKAPVGAKVKCKKCGAIFIITVAEPADPLVGKTLGGYEILEKLGEGGIGAVYKARQLSLSRLVAIKTLKPEFASNAAFVARLQREARSAAQISHPNIVQTIDVGSDKGIHFIAMELVQGCTLNELILKKGRLPVDEALDILEQCARALQRAHAVGIIHRDIKPENIIITDTQEVKLMDFGLAKRPESDVTLTQEGAIAGTPRYMSPEQGQGRPLDGRSDIYSLGATIYHALAGSPPFDGPTAISVILKHVSEPLPPLRTLNATVPPKVAGIIERMMAKNPDERFQTAGEVLAAISDARATLASDMAAAPPVVATAPTVVGPPSAPTAPTTPAVSPPPTAPQRRKRRRRVVAIVVSLTAIILWTRYAINQMWRTEYALREQEMTEVFANAQKRARQLANQDHYQQAINIFHLLASQELPAHWSRRAEEERQALRQEADERFRNLRAEAEACEKKKQYHDARKLYLKAAAYGIPEIKVRAEAEAQRITNLMESESQAVLNSIKEEVHEGRKMGRTDWTAIDKKYAELIRLYPDTAAAREAESLLDEAQRLRAKREIGPWPRRPWGGLTPPSEPGLVGPPVPAPTAKASLKTSELQKAQESVRALLGKNQYEEALKICEGIKDDDPWKKERIERLKRIIELKKLIIERINALGEVTLPSSLWQRKPEWTGGAFNSANEQELIGDVKGKPFKVRWDELTPDDVRLLAEQCTNRLAAAEQMALGIFCIEQGLTSKAAQFFNYAKSSPDKTSAVKEEADRFLQELAKPSPPKPATAPPPPTVSSTPPIPYKVAEFSGERIKELLENREWPEVWKIFNKALQERAEDPNFLLSAGIQVGKAIQDGYDARGPGLRRFFPLIGLTANALRRGLELAPQHPKAPEARERLAYLEKILEQNRPGGVP